MAVKTSKVDLGALQMPISGDPATGLSNYVDMGALQADAPPEVISVQVTQNDQQTRIVW